VRGGMLDSRLHGNDGLFVVQWIGAAETALDARFCIAIEAAAFSAAWVGICREKA
jgi:hypothetical protein